MISYEIEKINTILNFFPPEKLKYYKSLCENLDLLVGIIICVTVLK